VYRQGVRVTGRHVVIFLMRAEAHEGRFGVTASRRVGGAVVRSRSKRRLREVYRHNRQEFHAVDLVANARTSTATAPWKELEHDFVVCVRRATEIASRRERGS
jgi:ribonuclease P protein component